MSSTDDGSPRDPDNPDQTWWDGEVPNGAQRTRYAEQIAIMRRALEDAPQNRRRDIRVGVYPPSADDANGGDLADVQFLARGDTIVKTNANAERVHEDLDVPFSTQKSGP